MKKSIIMKRVLVSTMVSAALMSITVIASENSAAAPIQSETQETKKVNTEMKYRLVKGEIESIETKDGYTTINLNDGEMGMICNVKEDAFIINQADGSYKKASDLEKGMKVTGILENNTPMTLSIPPMTSGMAGFVIQDDKGGSIDLSIYDNELTNSENTLKLNIDKDTMITDIRGAKKVFTDEELKNSECLVLYTASTKSIPAQTSPDFVMILNNSEMDSAQESEPVKPEEAKPDLTKFSALREVSDSLGYKLNWTANDKPVILEKGDVKIEITVGSKLCSINGVVAQMETAPILKDSKITISDEYKVVFEKYSVQ